MHRHWTHALDSALVATYIQSQTLGFSLDEARERIAYEATIYHNGDFDECCFYISFGSTVKVPYHSTVEEVLTPILAEHGITWEQYVNQKN